MEEEFESLYERSYNSRFLPKEICWICFDTAAQMGHETEMQVECNYEDIIELVIKLLKTPDFKLKEVENESNL